MLLITPCSKTLARRNSFARPLKTLQRGFTLLELMVVIAIIGILFSFAALSVGTSDDKNIEAEAKRFAALMKLASEEAIINTKEIFLEVGKQQYQFLVVDEQGARPMEETDKVFRPRELPDHLEIKLVLEDKKVSFDSYEEGDFPRIGVFSSGEMEPFQLTFLREDGLAYGVEADFFGNVKYLGKLNEGEF